MATKGAKKNLETTDGVALSKVHYGHLLGHARGLFLVPAAGLNPPAVELVHAVAMHYAQKPVDDQGECGCGGISLTTLDRCPYCSADAKDQVLPSDDVRPAKAAPPAKGKASLAVVPSHVAEVVKDDLRSSSDIATERELDAKISTIHKLQGAGAENFWCLGKAVKELYDGNWWKLRLKAEDKTPRYKSWDAFVHHELGMTPPHAFAAMDVAAKFSVDEIKVHGQTKLGIIMRAPETAQPGLLAETGKQTTRELRDTVKRIKKESGFTNPARDKTNRGGTGGRKVATDKITVATMVGRKTVHLFKKPATRTWEKKDLVRAKRFGDVPFGTLELSNEVLQTFTIVENANGEWQLIVDTKRVVEEE